MKALSSCWFYSLLHPLLTLYPFSHLPDIETWVLMACFQLHTDLQISGMLEMISPGTGPACSATWGVSSGGRSTLEDRVSSSVVMGSATLRQIIYTEGSYCTHI